MVRYMKCPRCELNYIDAEKQEYCDVCLKEMKGIRTDLDDADDETGSRDRTLSRLWRKHDPSRREDV